MEATKPNQEDFIKKREEFTKGIRKGKREDLISKRRNIQSEDTRAKSMKIEYLIDQRYADYIIKFQKSPFDLSDLANLHSDLNSEDILKQHHGVIGIRRILSLVDEPPIQPIIDAGIVPKLIEFMNQNEYPQLQLESAWALANIASGTFPQCQSIIDKGVIEIFIRLLKSEYLGIIEQAVWALGNIASDSSPNRDSVIRKGAIPHLVHVVRASQVDELIEPGLWALSNLCRGKPLPSYELVKEASLTIGEFLSFFNFNEENVFSDCCWAVSYNFPKKENEWNVIVNPRLIERLAEKLKTGQIVEIIVPVIRICGYITRLNKDFVSMLLDYHGILDLLEYQLSFPRKVVRTETCWVFSNIVYSDPEHVEAVLRHEFIIKKILELFENDEKDVKKEICVFFSNMCHKGNPESIFNFLKSIDIMKYYVNVLAIEDAALQKNALECMHTIMQLGDKFKQDNSSNPFSIDLTNIGALNLLEELQMSSDQDVYDEVIRIMKDFFDLEDSVTF